MLSWKNIRLSGKFIIGFGVVIVLLIIVAGRSYFGVSGIVDNAKEVISGNKLRGDISQRIVDHLNWASEVSAFLNDENVHELNVQIDHTQCAFGKWYDSEERTHAEELVPELKQTLANISEPHQRLHESAGKIKAVYHDADIELGNFLREMKTAHLTWAHRVKDVFVDNTLTTIQAEMDPHQCAFGKWLYSAEVETLKQQDPAFAAAVTQVYEPHTKLHESAAVIQEMLTNGKRSEAAAYYMANTETGASQTLSAIDNILAWHAQSVDGLNQARQIYAQETTTSLNEVHELLNKVRSTVADNVMTDAAMLSLAGSTRLQVIGFSIVAVVVAIILALVISRGIVKPLLVNINFAEQIASGDLTHVLEVDRKDELGTLSCSLNDMSTRLRDLMVNIRMASEQVSASAEQLSGSSQELANSTTEQAASLEETSSAVEELTSSIQSNAENAQKTNRNASNSALEAEKGGVAVSETVQAMKTIAEKITVINDISDQTNLLALNAAIEAARAGEMGKGFAVVAVEVRKLAERSQLAAKEIGELATTSVGKAENAGKVIQTVVPAIQDAARLVQEIDAACGEQSNGAMQIRQAIEQLNAVTQQNSAASEEAASASEELNAQALQLQDMIAYFRVNESELASGATPSAPSPVVKQSPLNGKPTASVNRLQEVFEKTEEFQPIQ
ncbi:MAG: methyl-accepting chemotaxis protein [Candidatus Hinthialibacter antarcticus]|nr:methyl-accepting chemotaxis protein [Candidatus Hinthialibacter antarcticus]